MHARFQLLLSALLVLGASGCTHIANSGALTNSAADSKLVLIPNAVDFSTVAVGQKNTQTVKITNESSKTQQISVIHIVGAGLTISGLKFPFSLSPQSSATFNIEFAPTASGQVNGELTIATNLKGTDSYPVKGTGTKGSAKLEISPAVASFGKTVLKRTVVRKITVSNNGSVKIVVTKVILGGAGFAVSELPAHFELEPQQERSFLISFFPTMKGAAKGALAFVSRDAGGPVTMSMTGTGVDNSGADPSKSDHVVTLGWQASASNVEGYNVYRSDESTSSGIYSKLTASPISGVSYRDSDVDSGAEYQYFVTSVGSTGRESAHSDGVQVTIPNP